MTGRWASSGLPAVGDGGDPPGGEPAGHPLGVANGEAVHDARPRQAGDRLRQPRQPLRLGTDVEDVEAEAVPRQGSAHRHQVGAELGGDVGHHPVVGGGGAAQDGDAGRQEVEHPHQPAVVGTEIVAPVGDAVGLVDDEQPAHPSHLGQDLGPELGIGQPFGRDEEDVDRPVVDAVLYPFPLVPVGAVDGDRPDTHPLGGRDLVPHQGEERRHEQGRPAAPVPQHPGGDEVDGALAPPRPLDHEHPLPLADQTPHHVELVGTELARRITRQLPEQTEGLLVEPGVTHRRPP